MSNKILKVLKFGGSSVGHAESLKLVGRIVDKSYSNNNIATVVSAMYGVTDKLHEAYNYLKVGDYRKANLVKDVIKNHHLHHHNLIVPTEIRQLQVNHQLSRILDYHFRSEISQSEFITQGERLSSIILNSYLRSQMLPTAVFNADKLITLDSKGNVDKKTDQVIMEHIIPFIRIGGIPIITGYLCSNYLGVVADLGRGGSDYSSAIIASALNAKELEFWKLEAVKGQDGFMSHLKPKEEQEKWTGIISADPKFVKTATTVKAISYNEASELSLFGKKVLHRETMKPLIEKGIKVSVKNTLCHSDNGSNIIKNINDGPKVIANQSINDFYKLNSKRLVTNELIEPNKKIIGVIGENTTNKKFINNVKKYIDSYKLDAEIPKVLTGSKHNLSISVSAEHEQKLANFIHNKNVKH